MGRRNVTDLNVDITDVFSEMMSRAKEKAFAHLNDVPEEYRDDTAGILDRFAATATAVVNDANEEIRTLRQLLQNAYEQIASLERYRFGPHKETQVMMDGEQMTIEGMFDENAVNATNANDTPKVIQYVRRSKISNQDRVSLLPVKVEYINDLTEEQKNGIVIIDGKMMRFAGYQFVREEVKRVEIPTYRSRMMTPVFIEISDEQESAAEALLAGDGLTYSYSLFDEMESKIAVDGEASEVSAELENSEDSEDLVDPEVAEWFESSEFAEWLETYEGFESTTRSTAEDSLSYEIKLVWKDPRVGETREMPKIETVSYEEFASTLRSDTPTPRAGFTRKWNIDDIIPRDKRLGQGVVQVPCAYAGPRKLYVVPAPMPLISGSEVSPSLMAHIIALKYADAIPTYRMEKVFRRERYYVTRATLNNWLIETSEKWLTPLYKRLWFYLTLLKVVHGDETWWQVHHILGKENTSESRAWVLTPGRYEPYRFVLFAFKPDRSGASAIDVLKGFHGFLICDGYSGYNLVLDVIRCGCLCHDRRKWFEATPKGASPENCASAKAVKIIDDIFALERKCENCTPAQRLAMRQEKVKPLMDELFELARSLRPAKGSKLETAVTYTLNQEAELRRFLEHGEVDASNMPVENAIRDFVIGRKNWLFSDSERGAVSAALYYSLKGTAAMNVLEPQDYFEVVLTKLQYLGPNPSVEELDKLLPWAKEMQDSVRHLAFKPSKD